MSAGELLYAECKRLQEQCARLQETHIRLEAEVEHWQKQIEILWEIGAKQMTMAHLENALDGKLIREDAK